MGLNQAINEAIKGLIQTNNTLVNDNALSVGYKAQFIVGGIDLLANKLWWLRLIIFVIICWIIYLIFFRSKKPKESEEPKDTKVQEVKNETP